MNRPAPSRRIAAAWLRSLPKTELHLHLEGTVTPETLVELSQRNDDQAMTLEEARALYHYTDFTGFLLAFKAVSERLRTPEDYELITYRMLQRLAAQGVVHARPTSPWVLSTTGGESSSNLSFTRWKRRECARSRNSGELSIGFSTRSATSARRRRRASSARPRNYARSGPASSGLGLAATSGGPAPSPSASSFTRPGMRGFG